MVPAGDATRREGPKSIPGTPTGVVGAPPAAVTTGTPCGRRTAHEDGLSAQHPLARPVRHPPQGTPDGAHGARRAQDPLPQSYARHVLADAEHGRSPVGLDDHQHDRREAPGVGTGLGPGDGPGPEPIVPVLRDEVAPALLRSKADQSRFVLVRPDLPGEVDSAFPELCETWRVREKQGGRLSVRAGSELLGAHNGSAFGGP
ncbi:hypothetical protein SGFS_096490 [Streptomyces graminofaciens]|uniref:Uncharacterized protein n=1 Tax=Streptomyces graminofaciens TaxID=68212 RepID=A0ABM7FPY5_9ACTN|nr:hypothetical protein SGFS_096490 [Streptomyces graminofaciens]